MSLVEHVVIAAAGMGTRLGYGIPKCLIELEGRTLLERQLELLGKVPDVRIVVGFQSELVISAATKLRRDLIFVVNPAYRTTTTADSYDIGANGLDGWSVFLDADILFEPRTFASFLDSCRREQRRIGITVAKTEDAVYVHRDEHGRVTRFSRTDPAGFEWANAAWVPSDYFSGYSGDVFAKIARDLPVDATVLESYEVDTEADLRRVHETLTSRMSADVHR